MPGKSTHGNFDWLLEVQLGRRLLVNTDYGIEQGLECFVGSGGELTVSALGVQSPSYLLN